MDRLERLAGPSCRRAPATTCSPPGGRSPTSTRGQQRLPACTGGITTTPEFLLTSAPQVGLLSGLDTDELTLEAAPISGQDLTGIEVPEALDPQQVVPTAQPSTTRRRRTGLEVPDPTPSADPPSPTRPAGQGHHQDLTGTVTDTTDTVTDGLTDTTGDLTSRLDDVTGGALGGLTSGADDATGGLIGEVTGTLDGLHRRHARRRDRRAAALSRAPDDVGVSRRRCRARAAGRTACAGWSRAPGR